MSKHLIIDGNVASGWRLPSETDLQQLSQQIAEAVEAQSVLTVEVEMNDNPLQRAKLGLNGRRLTQWTVAEL